MLDANKNLLSGKNITTDVEEEGEDQTNTESSAQTGKHQSSLKPLSERVKSYIDINDSVHYTLRFGIKTNAAYSGWCQNDFSLNLRKWHPR